jgi:2-keto-myo-inositol isomerase
MTRRTLLLAPLASLTKLFPTLATARSTQSSKFENMTLSIHQSTSAQAGYRKSLEGWARAGIKHVELTPNALDDFLKSDSLPAARRVLSDLGLTPVSCSCGFGLWEPNPNRAAALEGLKKRCEMLASLGVPRTYSPCATTQKFTLDDYKLGIENMREVADIAKQFNLIAMVEFVRTSTFIATLTTALEMTRKAAHPNIHPMLDCYHFWWGANRLEDLDALRPGEIAHVHFQDVPDLPKELLDNTTRVMPGDGVTPLVRILQKLAEKQYSGSLSVELLAPKFQQADPSELAAEIRRKAEGVMRQARVL